MKRAASPSIARNARRYVCPECRSVAISTAAARWRTSGGPGQGGFTSFMQSRGVKRKTTVRLEATNQGALPARPITDDAADIEDQDPEYSITIQQHKNNMRKHPDCVVLTQMGNFWEMYFDQAREYSSLLGLKLAKKPTKRNKEGFVYMAGFPLHQLDRYLKVLVNDLRKHVAISKEIRHDPGQTIANNGNMFDRKVIRIVTPGTLIDENFIDPWANNFLLSIHSEGDSNEVGLAWVDLSCGDFFTQKTNINALSSAIARIGPREILLDQQFDSTEASKFMDIIRQGHHSVTYAEPHNANSAADDWFGSFDLLSAEAQSNQFSKMEVVAGKMLVNYVQTTQPEQEGVQLQAPSHKSEDDYMMIDKHSMRALEITQTLRDGLHKGSLLQTIRETVTQSGARLLAQRLKAPSMSLPEIKERLDLVQELIEHPALRDEITTLLSRASDSLRLVSRFAFGRGDPDDLLGLSRTVAVTAEVSNVLHKHIRSSKQTPEARDTMLLREDHIQRLLSRLSLEQPLALAKRIEDSIDEERLEQVHQLELQSSGQMLALANATLEDAGEEKLRGAPKGAKTAAAKAMESASPSDLWIMRRTASSRLSSLHNHLDEAFDEKDELEEKWRRQTGAKKLSLKWIQPHGHVVHIAGAREKDLDFSVLGRISPARSGTSTKSFFHHDWTVLGGKIEDIKKAIRSEEERVFDALRKQIVKNIVKLRNNAGVLDELDVACGFASLAVRKNWVRPIVNNSREHHIRGGRHPTVETGLLEQGKQFTGNDCVVGGDSRILLITGPNMGGKSTFLRQNALLSILAQTGSYVPAEYAEIGLVDKIFSRVGSADNLYQDQSTFMVEMLETADILKQATSKSFVIMDEVGRGTTPEDGIAVGFASLSHLYHVNRSRALFATHFHVLADMTHDFDKLACYCTDVAESSDGSFSYVHKLKHGINRNPHALKVARLAGMPEEAIAIASKVLNQLKIYDSRGIDSNSKQVIEEPNKLAASGG